MGEQHLDRRAFVAAAPAAAGLLLSPLALHADGAAKKKQTVLLVGAHRDDPEFGAGGLMFKALAAGHRVVVVQAVSDFSNWPPTIGKEERIAAADKRIARAMGVEKILLGYKYHHVPIDDALKLRIARVVDEVKPDLAFIMTETDHWTDHSNIARAAKDGILFAHGYLGRPVKKPRQVLAYAAGANQTYEFRPDTFVDVSDVIDRAVRLMADLDNALREKPAFTATLTLHGAKEMRLELTEHGQQLLAAATLWGAMCGVRHAQAFHSIWRAPQELW
jgi:LmbE family N-acetylglucosaminyl deacetylase